MYPESVRFVRAASLSEAADLLREHGPGARVLAGGQSLVPLMKLRLAVPDVLVDVSHLVPDAIVEVGADAVTIHALATHRAAGDADVLTDAFDVVADAIPQLADPQVRNVGTVGGALAEADPSGDWGPMLLATGGTVHTVAPDGHREIPAAELFTGPFETALEPAEVIEAVELPLPDGPCGGAYLKVKRRQGVYATASVGVHLELDEEGRCASIGVACAAVEPTYTHPDLSDLFVGQRIDDGLLERGADELTDGLEPAADSHGSAVFKRNLCARLFERAVRAADGRARGRDVAADPMGVA